ERQLLGAWRCVAPEATNPAVLTVAEAPDQGYRAQFVDADDKSVFAAYAVRFESTLLINAQEVVEGGPGKWTLVRYTLYRPGVLHLEFARDEPFRSATTREQRLTILRRGLGGTDLFEDYCTCVRIKER